MLIFNLIAQFGTGFEGPGDNVFNPGTTIDTAGSSVENIFSLIIGFLTVLAGLAFLLYFVFGGLQWVLAGGDQGKVDSAKKQMTNGAIGLIIIVVSYGIVAVVSSVLGLNILAPGEEIIRLNPDGNSKDVVKPGTGVIDNINEPIGLPKP